MGNYIGKGSIVTILYIDENEEAVYEIISNGTKKDEALQGDSALGQALIEKGEEGGIIQVQPNRNSGGDPYAVKILKIENPVERRQRVVGGCILPTPFTETEQRQNILNKRNIKRLVHFTRLENLQSILMRGIWSRQSLENYAKDFYYKTNDEERADGKRYCTSLSVSLPNYKMLSYLKHNIPNSRWVLLLIDPQVLCDENRALFCSKTNAAFLCGATLGEGATALEGVFEEEENGISRAELGLRDWEPTNPQAEILLSRKIEPKDIQGVIFENYQDFYWFKKKHSDDRLAKYYVEIDDDNEDGNRWFEPRQDYKYWQKRND